MVFLAWVQESSGFPRHASSEERTSLYKWIPSILRPKSAPF